MMKPSNFCTPRSMSEAMFLHSADPIERPESRPPILWKALGWAVFALLAVAAVAGWR